MRQILQHAGYNMTTSENSKIIHFNHAHRSGMAVIYNCDANDEPCKKASQLCLTMDCRWHKILEITIFQCFNYLLAILMMNSFCSDVSIRRLLPARSATVEGRVLRMTLTAARIPWSVSALR